MKTSTKIAIGIFGGLAVYLIYRMFSGYSQNSLNSTVGSNINQPTSDRSSLETATVETYIPQVSPATGPTTTSRSGRGHF